MKGFENAFGFLVIAAMTLALGTPADAVALTLTPITQVENPTNTPVFVFYSDVPGTISYNANCPSGGATATATPWDTTINFDNTTQGTYTDCQLTVTTAGGVSSSLTLDEFEIDTTAPILSQEPGDGAPPHT